MTPCLVLLCHTLATDTATHCNTLQHIAAHCSTLQHTATHCSTLQHTATHLQRQQYVWYDYPIYVSPYSAYQWYESAAFVWHDSPTYMRHEAPPVAAVQPTRHGSHTCDMTPWHVCGTMSVTWLLKCARLDTPPGVTMQHTCMCNTLSTAAMFVNDYPICMCKVTPSHIVIWIPYICVMWLHHTGETWIPYICVTWLPHKHVTWHPRRCYCATHSRLLPSATSRGASFQTAFHTKNTFCAATSRTTPPTANVCPRASRLLLKCDIQ